MIRPTPDTLPGQLLAAIVAAPGDHTAETLATLLLPAPKMPAAVHDPKATLAARRAALDAHRAAKIEHLVTARSRVARALSRLTEAGYLYPAGHWVDLHLTARNHLAARGLDALLALATDPDGDPDDPPEEPSAAAETILRTLAAGPTTYRALLGPNPPGATKEAYRRLADALVIRAPSHRVPTESGIALAAGWKS